MGPNNVITNIVLRRRRRSDTPESARAGIRYIQANPGGEPKKASRPNRLYNIYYYYLWHGRVALPTTRQNDDDDDDGSPSTERDELISTTDDEVRLRSTRSQMLRGPAARQLSHDAGLCTVRRCVRARRPRLQSVHVECSVYQLGVNSTTKWKNSRLRNVNNYYTLTQNI